MGSLPSGTVTFVFTDIEGSTKLAHQYPEQWESLRERHHTIMKSAMDAHNGYVFQIIGDAFCVAFHTARDGVNAAIEAQHRLQNEDWEDKPIKVRIGIHTGEATAHDREYHGYLTMSLVQRLMSAGHGGQILLSKATENLLPEQLSKGLSFRDMGEYKFKDILQPVRVFQVVAPDLQSNFPALRALDVFPNNLPTQLTSFVGREKELADVKKLLQDTHLLTLIGPGGTGKTRLSTRSASELLAQYPDGVWLVELAPILDPLLLPRTTATALGLREEPQRPVIDALCDYLSEKKMLIVLDNCEHLVDACAQMANKILHAAPHVRILASSREALGIAGEVTYRVPSLGLPDVNHLPPAEVLSQYEAVKLFIDRATSAIPSFTVTNDSAPFLAQICSRLDGIPLAIELAAAKVRVLNLEQIASRLDDRFRLLTGGSRTALERHQTLRATIDWSYNLLPFHEQALFRRLSVFVGGCTLEAAEAVCSDNSIKRDGVLELLEHLINKSMIITEETQHETRYRMLETIRQYADEKLTESDEFETMHLRHASFFLKIAEAAKPELTGPDQESWFERLDRERDNSRFALNWLLKNDIEAAARLASGLFWYWHTYTLWSEGREWYGRLLKSGMVLDQGQQLTKAAKAQVLYEAGWLAADEMDTNQSQMLSEQSLTLYRELGDKRGTALVLITLGWLAFYQNDFPKVIALVEESLVLLKEVGYKSKYESVLQLLGHVARTQGHYEKAIEYYKESLKSSGETGDKASSAYALSMWGYAAWLQGDLDQAKTLNEEGLRLSREVNLEWNAAENLTALGDIARVRGNYQEASKLYNESSLIWEGLGNPRERGYTVWSLGWFARVQGNLSQAKDFFNVALKLWQEVDDKRHIAECFESLAGVDSDLGQARISAKLMGSAEMIREVTGSPLPPIHRASYQQDVAAIRSQLGEADFIMAWEEGRALAIEQAIELALKELND